MSDAEVERLRRLRGTALQVRAVTTALGHGQSMAPDPLLRRARFAAWRVARITSGRLRAHPYARFQQDAGIGFILCNSIVAATAALGARTRQQVLMRTTGQLRRLAREVDLTRALTWAADLSEALGRSQNELRALLDELECATHNEREPIGANTLSPGGVVLTRSPDCAAAIAGDWPYLAL
ncbi:MAG: hypothetical protein M3O41_19765 [Pseudomonadota bacterium]|nr:hypothetical protein [Pseudomonadota bacterium]